MSQITKAMIEYRIKHLVLLTTLILTTTWSDVLACSNNNDYSPILIQESKTQGAPKSSSIIASINSHILTVVFCENLGQVSIEITTATGALVNCSSVLTPNGQQFYIPNAGNYIVTFTLSNGDEYYGEFTVEN